MPRTQYSLDGRWYFQIDRDEKGEARGYHLPSYRPQGWLQVTVPSNWDTYLPELFGWAGHAWYRRTFSIDPAWSDRRLHLHLAGANYETTVWLNGRLVGVHAGGFDPFTFDITDFVSWQGENTLAVRVDNWPRLHRVPNSYGGWWNYGGLYRSVSLLALPPLRLADLSVQATPDFPAAPLTIEATVTNESDSPAAVSLTAQVNSPQGPAAVHGSLATPPATLAAGERRTFYLQAALPQAQLWSPDQPYLYELTVALRQQDAPIDQLTTSFGVRRFEVYGTHLLLNGQPISLTGFNRHEEYVGSGRVDPGGRLEADLRLIKDLGGNMVRLHYQAHPDLYDLCDRLGLLVFAEIPLWGVGNKDAAELSHPEVWQTAEAMLRTLITTLKNHPSVVIWSVGNECATNLPEARPLIAHLVQTARALDASRPIAYVGCFGPAEKCYDLVDLPCTNQYFGLNWDAFGQQIDATHALAPDKPLLVTEFGHEAALGLHGEGYGSEEEQATVLAGQWAEIVRRRAFVPGGLIWCLADYWHMPVGPDWRWFNRLYFCHGIATLDRRLKQAAQTVRELWGRG